MIAEAVALDWRRLSTCAGQADAYDNAVDSAGPQTRAWFVTTFCDPCPVRATCLAYGKQTHSTGIFGGHRLEFGRTADQRRAARRLVPPPPSRVALVAQA